MKNLDHDSLNNATGGAQETIDPIYLFSCKKCGYSWVETTANPGDRHGCPKCGYWFMSHDGNRSESGDLIFDNECISYTPLCGLTRDPVKK